ncbi:hypothetical protein IWX84_000135 [Flavobacterium sp. CG_9.10]|nr:hypothetical protein [Flavobacterium sp. CG_9.10]
MANRTVIKIMMLMRYLRIANIVSMVASFFGKLLYQMAITMERLKQH